MELLLPRAKVHRNEKSWYHTVFSAQQTFWVLKVLNVIIELFKNI